jgi:hypothetical protein
MTLRLGLLSQSGDLSIFLFRINSEWFGKKGEIILADRCNWLEYDLYFCSGPEGGALIFIHKSVPA